MQVSSVVHNASVRYSNNLQASFFFIRRSLYIIISLLFSFCCQFLLKNTIFFLIISQMHFWKILWTDLFDVLCLEISQKNRRWQRHPRGALMQVVKYMAIQSIFSPRSKNEKICLKKFPISSQKQGFLISHEMELSSPEIKKFLIFTTPTSTFVLETNFLYFF